MSETIPNSFQTPNLYVDEVLELLTGEESKCLFFAVRHILGWRDKIAAKRGRIARRAFRDGFVTRSGKRYAGTGLSLTGVQHALNGLATYQLLIPVGKPTQDGQEWEIGLSPDLDGLRLRKQLRDEASRKRVRKAAKTGRGVPSDRTPQESTGVPSDRTLGVPSDRTLGVPSDRTNQTYIQTQSNPLKDAPTGAPEPLWTDGIFDEPTPEPYPVTAPEIAELIACWYDWTPNKPVQRGKVIALKSHIANKTIRAFAESLLSRGVTGADMIRMLQDAQYDDSPYHRLAELDALTFNYAGEALESWCAADEDRDQYTDEMPRLTARKPGIRVVLGGGAGKDVIADVPRPYIGVRQLHPDEQAIKELETFADLQDVLQLEDDEALLRRMGMEL